jgi:hypothetical protein
MKIILSIVALCLGMTAQAQLETAKDSELKAVTVFFQGAQLSRSFKTPLKPGRQLVVFQKLTDFLDPNSVQVKAIGDLTILSVRTRKNFEDLKLSHSEIEELMGRKTILEKEEQVLTDEYMILALDKNLLLSNRDLKGDNGLSVAELKQAYTFMHTELSEITLRHTVIEERMMELVKEINRIDQEIITHRTKPVTNYSEIVVEVDVNSATNAEFFANYISPNASWTPYYDMRSDGIGKPVRLEAKALVNQTTGIDWKDVNLTLSTNDPYDNTIEPDLKPWYIYHGNQPQQRSHASRRVPTFNYNGQKVRGEVIDGESGEPLPFAKISFASHPNVGTMSDVDGKFEILVPSGANYMTANFIGYKHSQQPISAAYLKFILTPEAVSMDQIIVTNSASHTLSREDISRMPPRSVDDLSGAYSIRGSRDKKKSNKRMSEQLESQSGGVNYAQTAQATVTQKDLRVEYKIESTFSIPSNGVDQRVSISAHELPANYEYHSAPKLDASVYLVAEVSGWEKLNLLNGESNLYFDGTYIGKTHVDANSLKDTLTFSLGKDSKIQIERKRIAEKSSNRVFGTRRKFEIAWEINVRNNGGASIPLIIKDQFPISNDDDIKIKTGEYIGAKLDEQTQILTWEVILSTGEKKTYTFDYKVDYHKSKRVYIE